jgi:microtubule-associated protein-like 6
LHSHEEICDAEEDFENDPEMNSIFRKFEPLNEDEEVQMETNDGGLFEEEEEEAGDQFMAVKPFLGEVKNSQPSDFFFEKGMDEAPEENLKLYYANGYRCFDAKNTAKFSNDPDSIVFVTAALGVNMNVVSNTQTFFNKHEEDVISFDLHPNRKIAASGQMAMKGKAKMIDIFVWDVETKEVLANLKGFHIRAIKLVRFSPSGKYLLTYGLDDDHSLAVYDWAQERLVCSSKVDKKNVLDSCFALKDDRKFLSIGSRHCKVWNFKGCNVNSGRVAWPKRLRMENSKELLKQEPLITCNTFSDNSYVVGTYKGNMIQITNGAMSKAWKVHDGPLSVFNNCPKYKRFFTGGRDGKVIEFVYERSKSTPPHLYQNLI